MDMPRWVGNGSDIFNARLVYKVGLAPPPVDHKCWILVWKFGGSMRFSVHIWQARCYGLKSRVLLVSRGLHVDPYCCCVTALN